MVAVVLSSVVLQAVPLLLPEAASVLLHPVRGQVVQTGGGGGVKLPTALMLQFDQQATSEYGATDSVVPRNGVWMIP
jgi:hypothetical protein